MAVDDLDSLRAELPALFEDKPLPGDWEESWHFLPLDAPESQDLRSEDLPVEETLGPVADLVAAPDFGGASAFPGAPAVGASGGVVPPPPDALAFYLPFHYFHPDWWGVYLVAEGVQALARYLRDRSNGAIDDEDAALAARLFLYGHEAFHHAVECFATRLEVSHRVPLYRTGFERLFQRTVGTDDCLEEALASAHGVARVKKRGPRGKRKQAALQSALLEYIEQSGPGYRKAVDFLDRESFVTGRCEFAELNHEAALPSVPRSGLAVWDSFPHAFTGMSRLGSRTNYIVQAGSDLAERMGLADRYLRPREIKKKLKRLGCEFMRTGRGSHEIWRSPGGSHITIPNHPRDLKPGTLNSILRQARVTNREFAEA